MIGLIQRVSHADIKVNGNIIGSIEKGILVFLGIEKNDTQEKANQLLKKILAYRIFEDDSGKLNLNVQQVNGSLLIVSQFTLAANTQKGTRASFLEACPPQDAKILYEYFIQTCKEQIHTETGQFGADMQVSLTNDGPVTFWLKV